MKWIPILGIYHHYLSSEEHNTSMAEERWLAIWHIAWVAIWCLVVLGDSLFLLFG